MDVNAVKSLEVASDVSGVKNNVNNQSPTPKKVEKETKAPKLEPVKAEKPETAKYSNEVKDDKEQRPLNREDMEVIEETLNPFMQTINSNLKFNVHEDTGILMMKVVDRRDGTVIKEIPSQDMLDLIARIRDSVGAFLDERA